ncbi:HmuY family protein [Pedobacter gandavensis]|uniref:HmuY family protein n=1 Tax=Pedobacter gandavensis TaxID=2679963 RepID=UPI0029313712|nr:HmuY family protein [Pedobacter gandavensis]
MNTLKYFKKYSRLMMIGIMVSLATACSKDDDPEKVDPPVEPGKVTFYKIQRVENLAAETDDKNPTVPKKAVYFSLEDKQEVTAVMAKTHRWDMGLSGLYNSFVSGNNGDNTSNFGAGGPGKGGVTIIEKPFDEVVNVPADVDFKTGVGLIGTDNMGDFGEGTGWYIYDFAGGIVGDSSYEKSHVAYALGSPVKLKNGNTAPARTLVIRTSRGNYAKIKMISCYKDVFSPDKWFRNTPHMYFSFEYVLVPKGSTKFELK